MFKLNPIQRRLIGLWLTISRALRLPRHIEGGVCWALGLPPLAGASGGEEGREGGEGGEGGAGGDGGSGEGGSGGGAGGDGGEGGGWQPPSKAEWDNQQRLAREAREKADKLEREQAERQRKADEEAGNFRAIAEREAAAREAAEKKNAELEAERERDREQREREQRDSAVTKIAGRLKFRDADDVLHRLSDEQKSSDAKAETALKKLANEKPYLLTDGEVPRQRDLGEGDGGEGGSEVTRTGVDRMADAYAANSKS